MNSCQDIILSKLNDEKTAEIFDKFNIYEAIVCGSVITDEFTDDSDVDIAVMTNRKIKLDEILKIEMFFEDYLGRSIDVVDINSDSLDFFVKVSMLNNGRLIYSKDNGEFLNKIIDELDWYYKENENFFMCRKRDLIS